MSNVNIIKHITPCNCYIFAWCTYYLQGTLYANGSVVSKLSLFYILLLGIYHVYETIRANNNKLFFSGLNWLLLLVSIYGTLNVVFTPLIIGNDGYTVEARYFLKTMLASLLPIYSCYYFSTRGELPFSKMIYIALILTLVCIFSFYGYHIQRTAIKGLDEDEDITNNYAYRFVALMPCLFLFNKYRSVQVLLFAIVSYFVLNGFKRGAVFTAIVCIIFYVYNEFKGSSGRKEFFIKIISLALLGIFCFFVVQNLLDNSYGFQRKYNQILEGDSSNRDIIYSSLLRTFIDKSSLWQLLFGWGAHQTVGIAGNYAHQDWLEFLIDCGIVGIIVLSLFFIKCTLGISRSNSPYKNMLYMSMLIIFARSLFSMGISDITFQLGLWIGWALSVQEKEHEHYS